MIRGYRTASRAEGKEGAEVKGREGVSVECGRLIYHRYLLAVAGVVDGWRGGKRGGGWICIVRGL